MGNNGSLDRKSFQFVGNEFSEAESSELYNHFVERVGKDHCTFSEFDRLFPSYFDDEKIKRALFDAIDTDRNQCIHFHEFIIALSTICFGDPEEKAQFMFDLIDLNHDFKVSLDELKYVCTSLSKLTHETIDVNEVISIILDDEPEQTIESLAEYKRYKALDEESENNEVPNDKSHMSLKSSTDVSGVTEGFNWIYIRSKFNGLYVDIKSRGYTPLTKIITWPWNGNTNQHWRRVDVPHMPGVFQLIGRSGCENLAAGAQKGNFGASPSLCLKLPSDPSTYFRLDGLYIVATDGPNEPNPFKDLVLDIRKAHMHSKGQAIILYKRKSEKEKGRIQSNQHWEIVEVNSDRDYLYRPDKIQHKVQRKMNPNAHFFIRSQFNHRLVLDVQRRGTKAGTSIITWEKKEKDFDNQLFYWKNGVIYSKLANKPVGVNLNTKKLQLCNETDTSLLFTVANLTPYLTIMDGPRKGCHFDIQKAKTSGGANILAWPSNEQANQRWDIIPVGEELETQNDETVDINLEEFFKKAVHSDIFTSGFGLFTRIYEEWIKPVQEKYHSLLRNPQFSGVLSSSAWNKDRYGVLANGFLNIFKSHEEYRDYIKLSHADSSFTPTDPKKPPRIHVQYDLWEANTKATEEPETFEIHAPNYTLILKADSGESFKNWMFYLNLNNQPPRPHRNRSFAPVHDHSGTRFFVSGKTYFEDLAKCLRSAKKQILITGWFITPQIHLIRSKNALPKDEDRLDNILLDRAKAGVQIYVLVWDEIDAAFALGSAQVKSIWERLHPNIQVLRDPKDMINMWSHHQKTVMIDQHVGFCGGIDVAINRFDDYDYSIVDEEGFYYPGRDYCNPMIRTKYIGDPLVDYMDRKFEPRMPWHDHQLKIVGSPVRDLVKNFIQRWNKSREPGQAFIMLFDDPLVHVDNEDKTNDCGPLEQIKQTIQEEPYSDCKVQVLRSAGYWSLGLRVVEKSLYYAHLEAIKNSKHFIYIENQFFVSSFSENQKTPKNKIVRALAERLTRAIENNENFRVVFVTPVHSSSDLRQRTLQILTQWQYASSLRGRNALVRVLQKRFPDVDVMKYFIILSMRNWGRFSNGKYNTEMVYVHSKLMIVDDDIVLLSSANINDRSMLGSRDSEIGAYVEDNNKIEVPFGGQVRLVSRMAHDLRKECFRILMGLPHDGSRDAEILDPVKAYDDLVRIARENTKTYIEVFNVIEDTTRSVSDIRTLVDYKREKNPPQNMDLLESNVHGKVVLFPAKFLKDSFKPPGLEYAVDKFFC